MAFLPMAVAWLALAPMTVACLALAPPLRPSLRPLRITACADAEADAGPDPEAWREFRAKLISGGLRLTGEEDGGGDIKEPEKVAKAASVAPKNEELLKEQNEELWREYLSTTKQKMLAQCWAKSDGTMVVDVGTSPSFSTVLSI